MRPTPATPPPDTPPSLPWLQMYPLRGQRLMLTVLDKREDTTGSQGWVSQLESDVSWALARTGINVMPAAENRMEVRLLETRADFEKGQWKACVKIAADITRAGGARPARATAQRCFTEGQAAGNVTGEHAMQQAYDDALAELLTSLDHDLR